MSSIQAAVDGQGIALGWSHLVYDLLAAGLLVRPTDAAYRSGDAVYIVMPSNAAPSLEPSYFGVSCSSRPVP